MDTKYGMSWLADERIAFAASRGEGYDGLAAA
jgi:hypothetical protein